MPQTVSYRLRGSSIVATSADGTLKFSEEFGSGNAPTGNFALANGTGTGNATVSYKKSFSIAAAGVLYVDLRNGTDSPEDVLNTPLAMTILKGIYIEMDTPGTGNRLVFGPSANGAVANTIFANHAMNMTIHKNFLWTSTVGIAIGNSTSGNIAISNPSSGTQTGELRVHGE